MHRTPQGHTLVVLVVAVGGLAVLLVYAVTRQTAPGGILTMITAVATGPAATYVTARPGRQDPPEPGPCPGAGAAAGAGPAPDAPVDLDPGTAGPGTLRAEE